VILTRGERRLWYKGTPPQIMGAIEESESKKMFLFERAHAGCPQSRKYGAKKYKKKKKRGMTKKSKKAQGEKKDAESMRVK